MLLALDTPKLWDRCSLGLEPAGWGALGTGGPSGGVLTPWGGSRDNVG